jgi:hypothetical protein
MRSKMTRRKKEFEERRQELISATKILSTMIQQFESTGDISFLRVVASQLRGLVVFEQKSRSLRHPLLVELAKEVGFPLTVFTIDKSVTNSVVDLLGPHQLQFFSTGDSLSLEKTPPYTAEQNLEDALESLHVIVGEEKLSIKQVIRLVADTEAAHYDPTRPTTLDNLDTVSLMGLPPEYRTIYSTGKIVRDLGYRFIQATT